MKYQDLLANTVKTEEVFRDARRIYIVSDRLVYIVNPHPELERTRSRRRRRLDPRYVAAVPQPPTNERPESERKLHIAHAVRDRIDGDFFELEDLTGVELMKVVELRQMVDDWRSGKLPELPASTATAPFDNDED